jgi:drug/metabolite transporter (DMT)-like permease
VKNILLGGRRGYLAAILLVTLIWGLDPVIMSYLYRYFSASLLTAIGTLGSLLLFLFLNRARLHLLNTRYLRVALPIGLLNSAACLLQKIGLQYTTPANYAFLEHLSCITVPLALLILIRKRPTLPQLLCAVLCLCGCFILCGVGTAGAAALAFGDILCALAGILLGVCVALTGVFCKELDLSLYMVPHMGVYFLTSLLSTVALHLIRQDGIRAEAIRFTPTPALLLAALVFGLISIGVCWLLKNLATVRLGPTPVAVISPFAAVISAAVSVLLGQEPLRYNLVIGAVLITAAVLFSDLPAPGRKK